MKTTNLDFSDSLISILQFIHKPSIPPLLYFFSPHIRFLSFSGLHQELISRAEHSLRQVLPILWKPIW